MNPNEIFEIDQNSVDVPGALMRAKSNLMARRNKILQQKRAEQEQAQPQPEPPTPIAPQKETPPALGTPLEGQSPFGGKYRVSQEYGVYNPKLYQGVTSDSKHHGVDFATPEGTQIRSPISGNVEVGQNKWYGNYVKIKADDGTEIQFSHLSSVDDLLKQVNQKINVLQNQIVGTTGNTGYSTAPHVDVMAWRGGQQIDPLTLSAFQNARL